ncbi:hypothetical protein [Jejuia pallidilutea]|uniref:Oligosaccharide repeat unit polymerase Wzy n=1 Tax=Jejuia pallidilutea TaxID=504487 RepID=A0A090VS20_9FLAO|nr:hypothetical protein [Jejuia pallidilutea]GAL67515.1 hypothetical protein JCM19301_488 [Jejuia pallidilutea]GAL71315.1 hypothetical protein JCM19302_992 [Jejuia pallidilutea]GAL88711.1 hypothetical protein JCM19538_1146 [Jejuia pallidilutea]
MITNKLNKHIVFLLFIVIVKTISPWSIINLGGVTYFWVVNSIVLFYILRAKSRFYDTINKRFDTVIFVFLIWNIFTMVRGCFVAENYWEWKNLITMSFVFLLPFTIYFSTHRELVQSIFNMYMKYMLPAFFLFVLVMDPVAYGVYLIPVSFMLLFLPLLSQKWKIITIGFALIVAVTSIEARSNVIKFVVALGFGILYYLRPYINKSSLGVFRIFLLVFPFVLFALAVSGTFNIFNISEYVQGEYTTDSAAGQEIDLTADTRTGLYVEVLGSAIKNEYVWFGRTYARGNDSVLFGEKIEALTGTGKFERYSNEVSILNIFTWTGLVGVILYFIIFIRASYLALYKSKSWFMKIIAVYVCFRWSYAWVEDFSRFDLSYICLWILIGMCYSVSFRNMTDGEFKYWVRGIFDIRYRKATLKKVRAIKQI